MKNRKEKSKILKIRPFNMANFSGGSGYLVFSLLYQAMAIFPAMVLIWAGSLIKLPKNDDGETVKERAGKRFYCISVPFTVVLIIFAAVLAFITNYGTFFEYWFEVILIVLAPTLSAFFIIQRCHKEVIDGKNVFTMIFVSFISVFAVLAVTFLLCVFVIDPILTSFLN